MTTFQGMNCCGLREIANLQSNMFIIDYTKSGTNNTLSQTVHYWKYTEAPLRSLINAANSLYPRKYTFIRNAQSNTVAVLAGPRKLYAIGAHFIFTDAHEYAESYGDILERYIKKHKLGTVTKSIQAPNRNYIIDGNAKQDQRHMITVYVWTVNWDNFLDLLKKNMSPELYIRGKELKDQITEGKARQIDDEWLEERYPLIQPKTKNETEVKILLDNP